MYLQRSFIVLIFSNLLFLVPIIVASNSTAKDRKHYLNYLTRDFDTRLEPISDALFDIMRLLGHPHVALILLCCSIIILVVHFFYLRMIEIRRITWVDYLIFFGFFWLFFAPNAFIQIRYTFAVALCLVLFELCKSRRFIVYIIAALAPLLHIALIPYVVVYFVFNSVNLLISKNGKYINLIFYVIILYLCEKVLLTTISSWNPYYLHFLDLGASEVTLTTVMYTFIFIFWKFKDTLSYDKQVFIAGYALTLSSIISFSFYLKLALPFFIYSVSIFYVSNWFRKNPALRLICALLAIGIGLFGTSLKLVWLDL